MSASSGTIICNNYITHVRVRRVGGTTLDTFHTDLAQVGGIPQKKCGRISAEDALSRAPRLSNGPWSVTGSWITSRILPIPRRRTERQLPNALTTAARSGGTFPCAIERLQQYPAPQYTFDLSMG